MNFVVIYTIPVDHFKKKKLLAPVWLQKLIMYLAELKTMYLPVVDF